MILTVNLMVSVSSNTHSFLMLDQIVSITTTSVISFLAYFAFACGTYNIIIVSIHFYFLRSPTALLSSSSFLFNKGPMLTLLSSLLGKPCSNSPSSPGGMFGLCVCLAIIISSAFAVSYYLPSSLKGLRLRLHPVQFR